MTLLATVAVEAQLPQQERMKRRIEQSIRRADADRAAEESRQSEDGRLPEPKTAVMNVDVQMVVSKADLKTFDEAKKAEAKKVSDGDPLWLYVRFRSRLGDYVVTTRDPSDPEKLRYELFLEIAPRGDITALNQYSIKFTKDDLAANELKIALAPAVFGRNKSIPLFLISSSSSKNGVWNNEFRLTNSVAIPRGLADNLASAPVVLEFAGGPAKYKKMESEYDSIILRGTTDVTKLPVAGAFFNEELTSRIAARLERENIRSERIYFSGDDWEEYGVFQSPAKVRRIFATFVYRRGDRCHYGVAEVLQTRDRDQPTFGEPEIKLQKDLPAECAQTN